MGPQGGTGPVLGLGTESRKQLPTEEYTQIQVTITLSLGLFILPGVPDQSQHSVCGLLSAVVTQL